MKAAKKRPQPSVKTVASQPDYARTTLLIVLLLLVLLSPFGKGLYWPIGRVGFAMVVLSAVIWALFSVKKLHLSHADMAGLCLVGLYALGMATPATRFGAVLGLISWAGYIGAYLLWRGLSPSDAERELLGRTVIASAAIAAIVGLVTYAGVVDIQFQIIGGRIASAFEYPNATASLFVVAIVLAVHRSFYAVSSRVKRILSVATVLLVTALVLTLSRGGWLAVALFLPIMVWLGRQKLTQVLYHTGAIFALGFAGAMILLRQKDLWGVLAALAVACLAFFAVEPPKAVYRALRIAAVLVLCLALVYVGVRLSTETPDVSPVAEGQSSTVLSRLAHRLLPYALADRIAAFSLSTLAADGRVVFFRDGIALLERAPLLGRGGGAWGAMYHQVQSFLYGTRRIHSDPYEVALDIGLLGLAVYLIFLWATLKPSATEGTGSISVALKVAAAIMLAHSSIEALLSFPAMYVVFFALLGAASHPSATRTLSPAACKAARVAGTLVCIGILVMASGIFLAEFEASSLARAVRRGVNVDVTRTMRRIARLSPWDTEIKMDLANLLWQHAEHRREVESLLERARQLDPYDPRIPNFLGQFRLQHGQYDRSIDLFKEALRLQPKNEQNYAMLTIACVEAALSAAERPDVARRFIEVALDAASDYELMEPKAQARARVVGVPPIAMTENYRLALAQIKFLAGDATAVEDIAHIFRTTGDDSLRIMSAMWYERILELQGRTDEAAEVIAPFLGQAGAAQYRARLANLLR